MHKICLLQQCCSYGPSKACAGIHAASLLHTACKKSWRAEVRLQGKLQANRGCVTLQRRGCRSNSGLEILRRTRSFPERTSSAGSVAAIFWQLETFVYRERAPSQERGTAPSQERGTAPSQEQLQAPSQEQLHGADLNVSAFAVACPTTS